jgi:hypothetical protein
MGLNPAIEKQIQRFMKQEDTAEAVPVDAIKQFKERKLVADSIAEELQKSLRPKGFYKHIPEILDERRLHYGIPNGAFESWPAFDKVYVWQIPMREGDTFTDGGLIQMPDQTVAYQRNTAPRGVVLSAGLKAMDSLHSTGIEIGHIIRFKKFAPFVMPVAEIKGHTLTVLVIRDGDIESSEDLAANIISGKSKIKNISSDSYDFRVETDGSTTGKKIDEYYDASV